jgi:hypothetical protein
MNIIGVGFLRSGRVSLVDSINDQQPSPVIQTVELSKEEIHESTSFSLGYDR